MIALLWDWLLNSCNKLLSPLFVTVCIAIDSNGRFMVAKPTANAAIERVLTRWFSLHTMNSLTVERQPANRNKKYKKYIPNSILPLPFQTVIFAEFDYANIQFFLCFFSCFFSCFLFVDCLFSIAIHSILAIFLFSALVITTIKT